MSTDDIAALLGWKWDAWHVGIALMLAGRVWHAAGGWRGVMSRGGIVGIVKAVLFGTNTPTPPQP